MSQEVVSLNSKIKTSFAGTSGITRQFNDDSTVVTAQQRLSYVAKSVTKLSLIYLEEV